MPEANSDEVFSSICLTFNSIYIMFLHSYHSNAFDVPTKLFPVIPYKGFLQIVDSSRSSYNAVKRIYGLISNYKNALNKTISRKDLF